MKGYKNGGNLGDNIRVTQNKFKVVKIVLLLVFKVRIDIRSEFEIRNIIKINNGARVELKKTKNRLKILTKKISYRRNGDISIRVHWIRVTIGRSQK